MKKEVLLIFLVALAARLIAFSISPKRINMDDTFQWKNSAHSFAEGKGFLNETSQLDLKRAPIYPLFLAAHIRLFGTERDSPIKLTQIFLSSLSCLLLYFIGFLLFDGKIGFACGMLLALYPPSIVYSSIIQSETLFTFLLLLFVLLWILAWGLTPIIPGIILGLLNLCRGTMLFFSPFLIAIALLFSEERKNLKKTFILIGVSLIMTLPWSWRNFQVTRAFIPIVSGGPELFWFGTLPIDSQKAYGNSKEYNEIKESIPTTLKEGEKFFRDKAIQNIVRAPSEYLLLTAKKFLYFWEKPIGHELLSGRFPILSHFLLLTHLLLIVLFLHGIILSKDRHVSLFPIYTVIAYFALFHTLLVPMPRFRLPIEPLLLIFATVSLFSFFRKKDKAATP